MTTAERVMYFGTRGADVAANIAQAGRSIYRGYKDGDPLQLVVGGLGLAVNTHYAATLVAKLRQFQRIGGAVGRLSGAGDDLAGIPETDRELPDWAFERMRPGKCKIAATVRVSEGSGPPVGTIIFNPEVWEKATPGQRATIFWHEWDHHQRYTGTRGWLWRWLGGDPGLGMWLDEFAAMKSATMSTRTAFRYASEYPKMSKTLARVQLGLIVADVAAPIAGYTLSPFRR